MNGLRQLHGVGGARTPQTPPWIRLCINRTELPQLLINNIGLPLVKLTVPVDDTLRLCQTYSRPRPMDTGHDEWGRIAMTTGRCVGCGRVGCTWRRGWRSGRPPAPPPSPPPSTPPTVSSSSSPSRRRRRVRRRATCPCVAGGRLGSAAGWRASTAAGGVADSRHPTSLGNTRQRCEHTAVNTPLWTHQCEHTNVNIWLWTHRTAVNTPLWTHRCEHTAVNTPLWTHQCEHMAVNTPHRCEHTAVNTPLCNTPLWTHGTAVNRRHHCQHTAVNTRQRCEHTAPPWIHDTPTDSTAKGRIIFMAMNLYNQLTKWSTKLIKCLKTFRKHLSSPQIHQLYNWPRKYKTV